MTEWISARNDRPKIGQRAVCVGHNGGLFIASKVEENAVINKNGVWKIWDGKGKYRAFTHWLPLPELFPKE